MSYSLLPFSLVVTLILLPNQISKGCGPLLDVNYSYTFIGDDLLAKAAQSAPFLLDIGQVDFNFEERVYQFYGNEAERQQRSNLEIWQQAVCAYAELEDIRKVVYEADVFMLQDALSVLQGVSMNLDGRLKGNSFLDYLLDNKCSETLEYLVFAKKCEPYVIASTDAWEERPNQNVPMEALAKQGLKHFRRTQSQFLKLRYAYQLIRLAHYRGDYQETLRLFDDLLPKIDYEQKLIYYWILGHKAGALMRIGRHVEASYLYGVIFKNCPTRRVSAFRSFYVRNDEDWQNCLIRCKDDDERAALYAIRACQGDAYATYEMERIYRLNPESPFLELLLVREMRKLEEDLLGQPGDGGVYSKKNRKYHKKIRDEHGQYVIDLQRFARLCREERKVKNPSLWYIAEGYLEFLAGDYYKAEKTFLDASRKVKNEALREQLEAFSRVLFVAIQEEIDSDLEADFYEITRDRVFYAAYPDFEDYFMDKIAELYEDANRLGLSFQAHYKLRDLRYHPDLEIIEDLIRTLKNKDERTRFERELAMGELGNDALKELVNLKATYWMSRGRLRRAMEAFRLINRADWDEFGQFTPFVEHLNDCIHCYEDEFLVIDTLQTFNKGEIVEQILQADSEARLGDELAAKKFYNIGLGLYNMSYFGHAWAAMDFYRSGNSLRSYIAHRKSGVLPLVNTPAGNRENFDVEQAKSYFIEARYMALEQDDRELAARATFMAAKCDQKSFYLTEYWKPYGRNPIVPPYPYDENYRILKEDYKDTDFYLQAIQECKYFRWYARN
ncbi:MAG: hypothetical protein AAF738_03760 [Bacteroidota bacterium]